jgi:diguanylate cyclase (GGDEF)-like protein/PAS domain S-box-containing protein
LASESHSEHALSGQHALELLASIAAAVDLTPMVAVRSVDRNAIVCFWNMASAQLYGTPPQQALGQPLSSLLSYGDKEAEFYAALEQIWQTGKPCPACDWHVVTRAGKTLWIYSTMFAVAREGEPPQIFCMDVDITARKQDEITLLLVGGNFQQLFEKSADAILLIQDDRIVDANPAAIAMFDYDSKQQMLGHGLGDFSPQQQPSGESSQALNRSMALCAGADGNHRYDWRYVSFRGRAFWAEVLLTSIALDHRSLFYAVIRDVSTRKLAERSLYLAAQVFENSRDAMLVTDDRRRIMSINRAYADVTAYDPDDMIGQTLTVSRSGLADPAFSRQVWAQIAAVGYWQGEVCGKRRNGLSFPAWLSLTVIRDRNAVISNYMGILTDITDRKKSEERTRHLAEHDFLTDLPNRVLLLDRLSLSLMAARRKRSMLAILFLDLDDFKSINDTLGHHVGDLLLKEVARRLLKCVRAIDTVSRQGGDEFVIILADIGGVEQAAHVAGSILEAITKVFNIGEYALNASTSVGISIYPNDGDNMDVLIKNADIAMYHAKQAGRNRFQFFNAAMNAQVVERATFIDDLRNALGENQFTLEYQPQIDIVTGAVVGAEALIRWQHPQLGVLPPERFIGAAEKCGLIIPIGNWVLEQACRQARNWHDAGHPLVVCVNFSVAQLMQHDLRKSVADALQACALPGALLELELSEAILMKGGANVAETLGALHLLGVKLTIDQFGTAYSRLSCLSNYPIDKLKIAQPFIACITGQPADTAIITTIIAVARSMKMKVSAEGVETAAQLDFLRSQGCDEYQGFLASPALPADELAKLLG